MKRYLMAAVVVMVVLGMVLVCVGQEGEQPAARPERAAGRAGGAERFRDAMRRQREAQEQALNAIDEEVKKMKTAMETPERTRGDYQSMSEEEQRQARENFMKVIEERQKSIENIEGQIARLKGARTLTAEQDEEIGKLKALAEQAKKENATETAAAIEKMIADKEKAFDEMLTKLGMERSSGSGRVRRPGGRQRGGQN